MKDMSVNGVAAAQQNWSREQQQQAEAAPPAEGAGEDLSAALSRQEEEGRDLLEMIRDAQEKAEAQREAMKLPKSSTRYGDAPLEAYARLARARSRMEVNAASGYARRRLAQFKTALRTDSDNAAKIKAAINQLQKAVQRAGKKNRDLERERVAQARQKKLQQEKRSREARRQKQELLRKQAMRRIRESGYLREAEVDNRMQAHIAAVDMELREQAQKLASSFQPSMELVAKQYAADSASMALPEELPAAPAGGEIDLQA